VARSPMSPPYGQNSSARGPTSLTRARQPSRTSSADTRQLRRRGKVVPNSVASAQDHLSADQLLTTFVATCSEEL
jgi:hypothetical protein